MGEKKKNEKLKVIIYNELCILKLLSFCKNL